MKAFLVSWYASSYCGTFRYMVVANNLDEAKEIWNKFVEGNKDVEYSWRKAEKGVRNHYGGYITWEEKGNSDKEIGCYKMDFDAWNSGSDHLGTKEVDFMEHKSIEEQKQAARNTNELLDHLMRIIEQNDERFSFEWLVGGERATMEIFDKEKKIGYAVKIEPIEYDENGEAVNL